MLQTTSFLVEKQLPDFVNDENPIFVEFLKTYYRFIELKTYSTTADTTVFKADNTIITVDQEWLTKKYYGRQNIKK